MTRSDFAVLPTSLASAAFYWLRALDVRCVLQVKQLVDGYKTADRLLIGTNEMMIVCDPSSGFLLRYLRYDTVLSAVWYPTLRLAAFVAEDGFDFVAVEPFAVASNSSNAHNNISGSHSLKDRSVSASAHSSLALADGGGVTSPRDEAALRSNSPRTALSERRESLDSVGGSGPGKTVWSSVPSETPPLSSSGGSHSGTGASSSHAATETPSSNPIRLMASSTKQVFQRLRAVTTVGSSKRPHAGGGETTASHTTAATAAAAAATTNQPQPAQTIPQQRRVRTASGFLCDDIDSAITDAFADRLSAAPASTSLTPTTAAGDSTTTTGSLHVTSRFVSSASSRSVQAPSSASGVAALTNGGVAVAGGARSMSLEAVEHLREGRFASTAGGVSTLEEFATWASLLSRSRYAHGVGHRYFDVHVDHTAHLSGWDVYHVKRPEKYSLPLPSVTRAFEALSATAADRLVALERYGMDDSCSAEEVRKQRTRHRAYTVEEVEVTDPAFVAAVQAAESLVDDVSHSSDTSPSRLAPHTFLPGESVRDAAELSRTSDGCPWEGSVSNNDTVTQGRSASSGAGGSAAVDGNFAAGDEAEEVEAGRRDDGAEESLSGGGAAHDDAGEMDVDGSATSTRRRGLTVFCAPPSASFVALPTRGSHRPLSAPSCHHLGSQALPRATPVTGDNGSVPRPGEGSPREQCSPLLSSSSSASKPPPLLPAVPHPTVETRAPPPEVDDLIENLTDESFVVVDDYIPGYRRSWTNRSPPPHWSAEQRIRWWRDHSSALVRENADLRAQVDSLTAQVTSLRSVVGDLHPEFGGLGTLGSAAPSMSRRQRLAF